ncbi:carbamate kinase [Spiroplasma platyhelix]|uniref:Carbamate kinase n=1 Tax=Spiroplasma platyhelix PALS-1 TaxID=1276218 RepID=A0A846UCP8_9MOLU|nr:carbamate kinase [Spiroplasma platyhelix]MBE4703915.1 Carbamate kinase 1 [Spiroplasma platyhelix PALS-1]NKE38288.1 carbamate kinase [Spiroplasma platyhelix PALS-1]UJB29173.1 carbamate kinase [Spiroplasma platyhelix PALS-1]
MAKIVVALGGNALGNNPQEQKEIVKETAKNLVDIIEKGNTLIICHGNGPQVGMINLSFSLANKNDKSLPDMPFPECGSMSQGYIAYHLQQAIQWELLKRNIKKDVAGIVTQTLVDASDSAFKNPSKPVGPFYQEAEAKELAQKNNWTVKEDANRGWRRVVASPMPVDILEKNVIKNLVDNGFITIAVGGGGIPVIKNDSGYEGVAAVIDKDFGSEKIAEILDADQLIILTAVDKVMINYGKPEQKALDTLTNEEAEKYIAEKQFSAGSMLPKVQAALKFINSKSGRVAIIASLTNAAEAIAGTGGTKFAN